jgi:hypothetical protein
VPDTATILMSAGVAASTTLLMEFAAKPRLELRKERILQAFRDKQSVIKQLDALAHRLGSIGLESVISAQQPLKMVNETAKDARALSAQLRILDAHCSRAVLNLIEYELTMTATTLNMVGHMYRRGASLSGDGNVPPGVADGATALLYAELGNFQLTADLLRLSGWHRVRRYRLSRAASQRLSFLKEGSFEEAIIDAFAPLPEEGPPSDESRREPLRDMNSNPAFRRFRRRAGRTDPAPHER